MVAFPNNLKKKMGVQDVPYERPIVDFIDALLEYAQKNQSTSKVSDERDWDTLQFILKGFFTLFPKSAADFEQNVAELRANQLRKHAIAKDTHGNSIQHKLKIPKPLYQMIKIIFPDQKWDEKFTNKFARRFPQFKVTHDSL